MSSVKAKNSGERKMNQASVRFWGVMINDGNEPFILPKIFKEEGITCFDDSCLVKITMGGVSLNGEKNKKI
ncbi:MAG: hypothetical protein V1494_03955 [Candidatus Diapherotrites archaeon]